VKDSQYEQKCECMTFIFLAKLYSIDNSVRGDQNRDRTATWKR